MRLLLSGFLAQTCTLAVVATRTTTTTARGLWQHPINPSFHQHCPCVQQAIAELAAGGSQALTLPDYNLLEIIAPPEENYIADLTGEIGGYVSAGINCIRRLSACQPIENGTPTDDNKECCCDAEALKGAYIAHMNTVAKYCKASVSEFYHAMGILDDDCFGFPTFPCHRLAQCYDLNDQGTGECFTSFDAGTSSGINQGNPFGLEPTNQVSVEAWVRNINNNSGFRYIMAKGAEGCSSGSYWLYVTGGVLKFGVRTIDTTPWETAPGMPSASLNGNGWHHIVGTYDGNSLKLYVDGVLEGENTDVTGDLLYGLSDSDDIVIGNYPKTGCSLVSPVTADIARVCIWTEALTAEEVTTLLNSYNVPAHPTDQCPDSNGCEVNTNVCDLGLEDPCGPNGQCQDTSTSYECACDEGYVSIGDPPTCATAPPCDDLAQCFEENDNGCFTTFPVSSGKNKGNSAQLEPTEQISVEAWVKGITSTSGYIVAKGARGCFSGSYFLYLSGGLKFGVKTGVGDNEWDATGGYSVDDEWHHIVGTYDSTLSGGGMPNLKLYVDGILEQEAIASGTIVYSSTDAGAMTSDDLTIGAYVGTCTLDGINADIERVCIWSKALSEEEVGSLFGSYDSPTSPSSTGECPAPDDICPAD